MAATAAQLSKTSMHGSLIMEKIKGEIDAIRAALLAHPRAWGRNVVTYDLPTSFEIPGLDRANAQRIMYSKIINILKEDEFDVRIGITDKKARLYIKWNVDFDEKELAAMNKIIADHRVTTKMELNKFLENKLDGRPAGVGRIKPAGSGGGADDGRPPAWTLAAATPPPGPPAGPPKIADPPKAGPSNS